MAYLPVQTYTLSSWSARTLSFPFSLKPPQLTIASSTKSSIMRFICFQFSNPITDNATNSQANIGEANIPIRLRWKNTPKIPPIIVLAINATIGFHQS
ncbi:MAG: hypothetical protein J6V00_05425 [Bacteroidaceae bacterium]|nr:hypothetical protein [Bacteroidaceae bacterium]